MTAVTYAVNDQNRLTALFRGWMTSFRGWIEEAANRFLMEQKARKAAAELHAMTDRELDDIGISRYDIDSAVRTAHR